MGVKHVRLRHTFCVPCLWTRNCVCVLVRRTHMQVYSCYMLLRVCFALAFNPCAIPNPCQWTAEMHRKVFCQMPIKLRRRSMPIRKGMAFPRVWTIGQRVQRLAMASPGSGGVDLDIDGGSPCKALQCVCVCVCVLHQQ